MGITLSMIAAGVLTNALLIFGIYLGFRMGRLTKDSPDNISIVTKEMPDKDVLDTPDIFSESINDGTIDDPDARIRTI